MSKHSLLDSSVWRSFLHKSWSLFSSLVYVSLASTGLLESKSFLLHSCSLSLTVETLSHQHYQELAGGPLRTFEGFWGAPSSYSCGLLSGGTCLDSQTRTCHPPGDSFLDGGTANFKSFRDLLWSPTRLVSSDLKKETKPKHTHGVSLKFQFLATSSVSEPLEPSLLQTYEGKNVMSKYVEAAQMTSS